MKKSIFCCSLTSKSNILFFRAVFTCKRCLICADFSLIQIRPLFHWGESNIMGIILAGTNGLRVLKHLNDGFVSYKQNSFCLLKMLTDGLVCVDYLWIIVMFLFSCLDSHSDGTHSLQRIHWWATVMNCYISPKSDEETWPEGEKYIQWMFLFWVNYSFNMHSCIVLAVKTSRNQVGNYKHVNSSILTIILKTNSCCCAMLREN